MPHPAKARSNLVHGVRDIATFLGRSESEIAVRILCGIMPAAKHNERWMAIKPSLAEYAAKNLASEPEPPVRPDLSKSGLSFRLATQQ